MITTQPLLKLNDYILVNGNRRKVIFIGKNTFEWNYCWASISQLETNPNPKSKILFTLNN